MPDEGMWNFPPPNDIEFSGEKEGAQRLTPSPLQ